MQTDPIGYEDGIDCYAYVGNDPINNVDPTGMEGACFYGPSQCGMRELTPEQQQDREDTVKTIGTIAVSFTRSAAVPPYSRAPLPPFGLLHKEASMQNFLQITRVDLLARYGAEFEAWANKFVSTKIRSKPLAVRQRLG